MNCKPHQPAWISVPASNAKNGVEKLHGRVVTTVKLLPRNDMPIWEVDPPQRVKLSAPSVDSFGGRFNPGDNVDFVGIPDAWLRPFDPESKPVDEPATEFHCIDLELAP